MIRGFPQGEELHCSFFDILFIVSWRKALGSGFGDSSFSIFIAMGSENLNTIFSLNGLVFGNENCCESDFILEDIEFGRNFEHISLRGLKFQQVASTKSSTIPATKSNSIAATNLKPTPFAQHVASKVTDLSTKDIVSSASISNLKPTSFTKHDASTKLLTTLQKL
uniref:Uncharacterized protein n=1 Tax=Megaselia scalaris TaxID=36166 RepID=T1GWM8_MEGSC